MKFFPAPRFLKGWFTILVRDGGGLSNAGLFKVVHLDKIRTSPLARISV
jgi:hypothetical protein